MTSLTNAEIKTVYFGITFFIVVGVLASFYNMSPIPDYGYQGESEISAGTAAGQSDWISSLINGLPEPFNNSGVAIVTAIFITPVSIFLGYIAIRAIKDLITQWV